MPHPRPHAHRTEATTAEKQESTTPSTNSHLHDVGSAEAGVQHFLHCRLQQVRRLFFVVVGFQFCGVFKGLVFVLFVLVFCGWGCFFYLVWLVWVRLSVGLISVESRVCRDGGGHWPIQSKTRPALYNIIHPSTSIHPSNHIALSHTSPWAVRGRSEASWRPTKSWPAGSPCPVFMVFIFVCLWG